MALTPKQIAELLKLRALGWSQAEIAEKLETSQQVIGYQLKNLKNNRKKKVQMKYSMQHLSVD
jgi:transcriptional regulator